MRVFDGIAEASLKSSSPRGNGDEGSDPGRLADRALYPSRHAGEVKKGLDRGDPPIADDENNPSFKGVWRDVLVPNDLVIGHKRPL